MVTFFFLWEKSLLLVSLLFHTLHSIVYYSVHFSSILLLLLLFHAVFFLSRHETVRFFSDFGLKNNNNLGNYKRQFIRRKPTDRRIMRWFWYYCHVTKMSKAKINLKFVYELRGDSLFGIVWRKNNVWVFEMLFRSTWFCFNIDIIWKWYQKPGERYEIFYFI